MKSRVFNSIKISALIVLAFGALMLVVLMAQKARSQFYEAEIYNVSSTLSVDQNTLTFASDGYGACLDDLDPDNHCARTEYVDITVVFDVQRIVNNSHGGDQWSGYVYYPAQTTRWSFPGFPNPAQRSPTDLNGTINTSSWPSGTYRFCATVEGSTTALWPIDAYGSQSLCAAPFTITRASFDFTCDVMQIVVRGDDANFGLYGNPSGGYSGTISVTMDSSPKGANMDPTPVLLESPGYAGIATIPTGDLEPGGYDLTFTATDGSDTQTCLASLTVDDPTGLIDLKFNDSDGPTQPTPSNGSTGTLTWTPFGDVASCTASMVTGSVPAWSGPKGPSGSQLITGLQPNTQYVFRIDCVTSYGNPVEYDQVEVNVGPANPPTATLLCLGDNGGKGEEPGPGPCTIPYQGSAELTWSSTYANSCSISPGSWPTTTSGSGSTSNLSSNQTYTLTCTGAVGTTPATSSVDIIVEANPTFTATCTPATITITQGSSTSYNLNTFGADGFNSPVTWSVLDLDPPSGNQPSVNFQNNGQVPNATTVALITTTTSTASEVYTIIFRGSGGSITRDCSVELIVNPVAAPNPPTNVQASNAVCGQIALTWSAPSGGDTPEGYRVYRKVNGTSNWGSPISGNIPFGTNSYVDSTAVVGTFYNYGVRAYIGGSESTTAEASPASITPVACNGNISTSDKDVIAYEGNASMPPLPEECNHNPNNLDVFRLPNNAAFQVGKTVTFRMSICNTGNTELTSTTVNDVMTNVSNPTNFNYSGCTNPSQTVNNPTSITFTTGSLAPGGVCRITYNAVITAPTGPSAVYRFQNRGNMTAQSSLGPLNHSAYTLPYTFTIQSGPPTRQETAR